MPLNDGETMEQYRARMIEGAKQMQRVDEEATARRQSLNGDSAAPPKQAVAEPSRSGPNPDLVEIRKLQAEARARGMTQTVGGRWLKRSSLKMSSREFETACEAEFRASAPLQAAHGDALRYAVARFNELEQQAEQRTRVDATGLPVWIAEARAKFAASPALQEAFGSEMQFLAHTLAEQSQ